jgi:hypothetical protein
MGTFPKGQWALGREGGILRSVVAGWIDLTSLSIVVLKAGRLPPLKRATAKSPGVARNASK